MTLDLEYAIQHYAKITKEYEEKIKKLTMLDIAICHCEEVAEENEKKARKLNDGTMSTRIKCEECASEYQQLAEWLKELKDYKRLGTYSRPYKCGECIHKDSEYYCGDCIWHYVDKFKPKEVNADED